MSRKLALIIIASIFERAINICSLSTLPLSPNLLNSSLNRYQMVIKYSISRNHLRVNKLLQTKELLFDSLDHKMNIAIYYGCILN